jgi:hypothetical protein
MIWHGFTWAKRTASVDQATIVPLKFTKSAQRRERQMCRNDPADGTDLALERA